MFWLEHVGIVVKDLDESIAFYSKLFGSPPVQHVSWRGSDADYIARLVGQSTDTFQLDAAFFQIPYTNSLLELLSYGGFDQKDANANPTDIGATHIGFYVESIDRTVNQLDLQLTGEPVDIPYGPYKGGRSAYSYDPNGVTIQLMEIAGRPGALPILRSGDFK